MGKCWKNENGFTLIELMVVVGIIMALAAIAIPKFVQYRQSGYDAAAASDIKNAFIASQAYFTDFEDASITIDKLKIAGYQQTDYVNIKILDDQYGSFKMEAKHSNGKKTYSVDGSGKVRF